MRDHDPATFDALADPTRWRLLGLLGDQGYGTASSLARQVPVSRPAVIKHLGILERAGLVERRRVGREVRFTVRPSELESASRMLSSAASRSDARLAALKRLAENP